MNARQKAKKYKRELERLKGITVRPMIIERRPVEIKTIGARCCYGTVSRPPEDFIKEDLADVITRELVHNGFIHYDSMFDTISGQMIYTAHLDIVVRE